MRTMLAGLVCLVIALASACGDEGGCPGKICSNCSGSGDCNITCAADEIQVCRAHPEGDTTSAQRCTYCTKR